MSGPPLVDWVAGAGLDLALFSTLPLGAGLLASWLPGSASARHARIVVATSTLPVLAVGVWLQGNVWTGAPSWPWGVWSAGTLVAMGSVAASVAALHRLRIREEGGLWASDQVRSPMTWGWWRPRILVPADFASWPESERAAALVHERAHIRRRDWLVTTCLRVLAAMLWFHPLMWAVLRRTRLLAECAADDAVLTAGHDRASYAEQLLKLRPGASAALGLGDSPLGLRIRAILDDQPRGAPSLALLAGIAVVLHGANAAALITTSPEPPVHGCLPADPPGDSLMTWLFPSMIASTPALASDWQGPLVLEQAELWPARGVLEQAVEMERVADHLERMPRATQGAVIEAADRLSRDCAYRRALFMVPIALERELSVLSTEGLPEVLVRDLERVHRGVRAQARAHRALQLTLPQAGPKDHLWAYKPADGGILHQDIHALAYLGEWLKEVDAATASMTPEVQTRVADADHVLRHKTTLMQSAADARQAWRDAMVGVEVAMPDHPASARMRAMVRVLDTLDGMGC